MRKWHQLQLTVQKAHGADIEQGRVRIPRPHRADIERGTWCEVRVAGRSIVTQVYGEDDANKVILLDRTYRDELGVTVGSVCDLELREIGYLKRLWYGWWNHPQVGVHVSARLGLIGVVLGLIGLVLGAISVFESCR